ncbi:hypothetical protein [Sulfurovum sp.]|uniref:hypothetical protein n=1 Tax=Sulfurovum sp. TaxID=1969726 RepID=UPI00356667E6
MPALPEWAQPIEQGKPAGLPEWAQPVQQQEAPGFTERTGEALQQRGQQFGEMIGRETAGGPISDVMNVPRMLVKGTGVAAGGLVDVAGEGLRSAYNVLAPEYVKERVSATGRDIAATPLGRVGLDVAKAGGEMYGKFAKAYPEAAEDIGLAGNIAMVTPLAKGAKGLAGLAKATPERLAKKQSAEITKGIQKSIRPGVEGKRTFGQAEKYYGKAQEAVESIVKNKEALKLTDEFGDVVKKGALPENLRQFSQAIEQSKKNVFKKYNSMAEKAGDVGAKIELRPIASELEKVISSRPLKDNAPEVVRYAKQRANALSKSGKYTAEEAQDAITFLNSSLESFYKSPSYESASKAYIDSLIANNMRKNLDSAITKASGPGYQELKRQYGALKTIERDVARRAVVDARKAGRSLIDFSDVFSGERAVTGLLTMNPAAVGQAASMRMIASAIKAINDPNRVVKSMFKKAEKGASKLAKMKQKNALAKH